MVIDIIRWRMMYVYKKLSFIVVIANKREVDIFMVIAKRMDVDNIFH